MTTYRIFFVFGLLCIVSALFIFARQHRRDDRNISVSVSESKEAYKFRADYPTANHGRVCDYLEKQLGRNTNINFHDVEIDGHVVLDNQADFYLLLEPGKLRMTLNKKDNSYATYEKFSQMGRELKEVATGR